MLVGGIELSEAVIKRLDLYSMPEPNSGCWLWFMAVDKDGYGKMRFNYKDWRAHRISFAVAYGFWPVVVRHKCDNPYCINPDHLEAGTHLDNVRDRHERHRAAVGERQWNSKLTNDNISEIRNHLINGLSLAEIGHKYGVEYSTIARIRDGESWKSIPSDVPIPRSRNKYRALTEHDVSNIKARLRTGEAVHKIATDYGSGKSTIWKIKHGRIWRHIS